MPIINSISTADNTTLNTFSGSNGNGFTNQLVYFIVQLVIQTEYASNGNKPLTQKQITELFNIGASMSQMYTLTVKAGFADDATFLNSIPLAYAPTDATSKSIFDEIIDLQIPNMLDYVSIIKYVNTPGPACWAFGSVANINASLSGAFAIDSTLGTLNLINLKNDDNNGSDGNSINALWKFFNTANDFPPNYTTIADTNNTTPLKITNVQKSILNWVALDNFLTGSASWSSAKTYNTLVSTAKIPLEVLLCSNPYLVSTSTSNFAFSKANITTLNKIWVFLTNGSIGASSLPISFDQVSYNNPIVSGLDFKSALAYLKIIGYTIKDVMNVDTKSRVIATTGTNVQSNAVSEVVKQLAAKPSLIYDFVDIYETFSSESSNNYYLFDLIKKYNDALAKCLSVGTVSTSNPATTLTIGTTLNTGTPAIVANNAGNTIYTQANLTFDKVFLSTILPVTYTDSNSNIYYYASYADAVAANPLITTFKVNNADKSTAADARNAQITPVGANVYTAATTAQINAFNALKFINAQLNNVIATTTSKNLAFRLSLNGFYPLSTLNLQQAAPFIFEADTNEQIFNLLQDSANYTAAASNANSFKKFIQPADLYLFNKLIAIETNNIKVIAIDTLNTKSFDFVTMLKDNAVPKLIKGDGSFSGDGSNPAQNWNYVIEHAIAAAYSYNTSTNNLTILVNGINDYAIKGAIGNITLDSNAVSEIDSIIFTSQTSRIARAIGEVGVIRPNDWQAIANLIGQIMQFGTLTPSSGPSSGSAITLTVKSLYDLAKTFTSNSANGNSTLNQILGGDIDAAIAAYILFYDCPVSTKLTDLDLLFGHVVISGTYANVARRMLTIADSLQLNLGQKLVTIALSSGTANKILNITNLINFWFSQAVTYNDKVPTFTPSQGLTTIINSFFGLSGLQMSDMQNQIIIKKLMNVYNGVSNDVINAVYANNKPLGMWAKYVNLAYLCYTDASKAVTNYDVDEILTVSQQISIYDFASGRSTGIVNIELITAENLVQFGVIEIGQLPEYIAYTQTQSGSSGSIVTSQQVQLQLIVAIAKAMDTGSATRSYTTRLFQRIVGFTVATNGLSGWNISNYASKANILQQIFSAITGLNPRYYDGPDADGIADGTTATDGLSVNNIVVTSPITDSNAILTEINKIPATAALGLSTSDINAVLNWVFKGYNADGTPLPFADTSSYYSYYNGEY